MKFTLTITDASAADIARIAALLNGTSAPAIGAGGIQLLTQPPAAPAGDDESSDVPAVAGTVDATGLPWDERIHSNPAKLTSKNVWRSKRGVSDALVKQVEAELRNRAPAPVPQHQQPAPAQQAPQFTQPSYQPMPGTAAPAPVQQQPYAPPPMQQPAPAPVPQYQQPAPPPPAQFQPGAIDFGGFMQRIQQLVLPDPTTGQALVDGPYLTTVCQRIGAQLGVTLNAITDTAANQQYVDAAIWTMINDGRWR